MSEYMKGVVRCKAVDVDTRRIESGITTLIWVLILQFGAVLITLMGIARSLSEIAEALK